MPYYIRAETWSCIYGNNAIGNEKMFDCLLTSQHLYHNTARCPTLSWTWLHACVLLMLSVSRGSLITAYDAVSLSDCLQHHVVVPKKSANRYPVLVSHPRRTESWAMPLQNSAVTVTAYFLYNQNVFPHILRYLVWLLTAMVMFSFSDLWLTITQKMLIQNCDWLRAGRPGNESRWGEIFLPSRLVLGAHPASCTMGTGSFPEVKYGRGVLLTTHPLLVPLSWKSRAIPLPTLWATTGPVTGTLYLVFIIQKLPKIYTPFKQRM